MAGRIKAAREAKGWDRRQLAAAVDTTSRAVRAWETGERLPPIETLAAVADALSVTRGHLLGDDGGGPLTAERVRELLGTEAGADAVLRGLSLFVAGRP